MDFNSLPNFYFIFYLSSLSLTLLSLSAHLPLFLFFLSLYLSLSTCNLSDEFQLRISIGVCSMTSRGHSFFLTAGKAQSKILFPQIGVNIPLLPFRKYTSANITTRRKRTNSWRHVCTQIPLINILSQISRWLWASWCTVVTLTSFSTI